MLDRHQQVMSYLRIWIAFYVPICAQAMILCPELIGRWDRDEFPRPSFTRPSRIVSETDRARHARAFIDLMVRVSGDRFTSYRTSALSRDGQHRFEMMGTEQSVTSTVREQYYRIQVRDGILRGPDGKPYDTSAGIAWTEDRSPTAIYVMDERGSIYSSTYRRHLIFHHSSFLAGESVAASGEWQIHEGKPVFISQRSGHYMQSDYFFAQHVYHLYREGIDLEGVKLRFYGAAEDPVEFVISRQDLESLEAGINE